MQQTIHTNAWVAEESQPNAGCSGSYETAWGPDCSLASKAAFNHGHIESLDSWVQSYTWGLPPRDRDRLAATSEHKKSQVHRSSVIAARYLQWQNQDLCHLALSDTARDTNVPGPSQSSPISFLMAGAERGPSLAFWAHLDMLGHPRVS